MVHTVSVCTEISMVISVYVCVKRIIGISVCVSVHVCE